MCEPAKKFPSERHFVHRKYSYLYFCFKAVDCGPAPMLIGASLLSKTSPKTTYGSRPLQYECGPGYWFSRDKTSVSASCLANATWNLDGSIDTNKWPSCYRE